MSRRAPSARKRSGAALLTRREIAAIPDLPGQAGPVAMMTVSKWEQRGMPVAERGRKGKPSLYSEAEVRAWLEARDAAAKAPGASMDLAQERAHQARVQRQIAEQTLLLRLGELAPRAEMERAWSLERDAVRAKLLAVPVTYADRVARAATLEGVAGVERALREAVNEVLRELADGSRPDAQGAA